MAIIITYDVPSKHVDLKAAMKKQGYVDQIPHDGKSIYLPNTTLYHPTKKAEQAREDVKQACVQLNVKLERCVSTQSGPDWSAIWGEPFKS
jgi:hypothetical protein